MEQFELLSLVLPEKSLAELTVCFNVTLSHLEIYIHLIKLSENLRTQPELLVPWTGQIYPYTRYFSRVKYQNESNVKKKTSGLVFLFGPTWRSYKLTCVRPFVRLLPAFLGIGS